MKKSKQELNQDPWDQVSYETGSTKPPKDHGGAVAVLLAALILVGSICSALGILNVKLLKLLRQQSENAEVVSVFDDPTEPSFYTSTNTPEKDVTLCLKAPPQTVPVLPADTAFSWLVKITCGTNTGTGLVMTEDGYIITNAHTLHGGDATVTFNNGMQLSAVLVGKDEAQDVAVLRVQASGLTPASFGHSAYLQEGDALLLVGEELQPDTVGPDGFPTSRTNNRVVINCYGQVVGIPVSSNSDSGCLMTEQMKPAVDRILAVALFREAELGITGQTVSDFDHRFYNLPYGVLVTCVNDGLCADIAGLRSGDVITGLDDTAITNLKQLQAAISRYSAGDTVTVELYRPQENETLSFTVKLSEAEE